MALVLNPSHETSSSSISSARSQGYQRLVLNESAEPSVMRLPQAWPALVKWLQVQLGPPWAQRQCWW